jgi:glutamine synthetase
VRALAAAANDSGLELRVGFESEFVLLKAPFPHPTIEEEAVYPNPQSSFDCSAYASASAADSAAEILDEIHDSLAHMGIRVEQMHAEAGPGQFEVVTQHFPALEAADNLLLTRQAIVAVAAKHGSEPSSFSQRSLNVP